uniref:Uncharacterized protein n=1 Tax=Anopheles christyi TaxID=43041 RepID=A0A182KIC8_9DIPT
MACRCCTSSTPSRISTTSLTSLVALSVASRSSSSPGGDSSAAGTMRRASRFIPIYILLNGRIRKMIRFV